MTTYYARTRALDPATGDLRLAGGNYVAGNPMLEVVLRVLRTPRGSYLPDPTFGVDMTVLRKASVGVAAAWRAAVIAALRRYTDRGLITDLKVTVETEGSRLYYSLEFVDPRSRTREPTRLARRLAG
jgi:phage baseplate assembly protein W